MIDIRDKIYIFSRPRTDKLFSGNIGTIYQRVQSKHVLKQFYNVFV